MHGLIIQCITILASINFVANSYAFPCFYVPAHELLAKRHTCIIQHLIDHILQTDIYLKILIMELGRMHLAIGQKIEYQTLGKTQPYFVINA